MNDDLPAFSKDAGLNPEAWSVWLWPDPFEAPEVPPRHILRAFLDSTESFKSAEHDFLQLREQIAGSIHCRRALNVLADELPCQKLPKSPVIPGELTLLQERFPIEKSGEVALSVQPVDQTPDLDLFQIYNQTHEVFRVDASGNLSKNWLWNSTAVLIVQDFGKWLDDRLLRAIACTPAELVPEWTRCHDDLLVRTLDGAEWVAHVSLEFPMAASQLHAFENALVEASIEDLCVVREARAEGLPVAQEDNIGLIDPAAAPDFIKQERARRHDVARWMAAGADALLDWVDITAPFRKAILPEPYALKMQEMQLQLMQARDLGNETFYGLIVDREAYLAAEAIRFEGNSPEFKIQVLVGPDEPETPGAPCEIEFYLQNLPDDLRGGETFLVYKKDSRKVIGSGILNQGSSQYVRLRQGIYEDFPSDGSNLLMVILRNP